MSDPIDATPCIRCPIVGKNYRNGLCRDCRDTMSRQEKAMWVA